MGTIQVDINNDFQENDNMQEKADLFTLALQNRVDSFSTLAKGIIE